MIKPGLIFTAALILVGTATASAQSRRQMLGRYADKFRGEWVKGKYDQLQYQIFAPKNVSPRKPLPVVLTLHGSNECGNDNHRQARVPGAFSFSSYNDRRPCIVIAPQCWLGTTWMAAGGEKTLELLDDILKEVKIVDKDRIYITGFSLGGFGTWHLLAKRPNLFAAAAPVAGGGQPEMAKDLQNVDVLIFHGRKDPNVPVVRAHQMAKAMKKAGGNVKVREYKNASHGIQKKVYYDKEIHEWLFKQKRD